MNAQRASICAILLLVPALVLAAEFPTVAHEGRPYVELSRIAATLGSRVEGTAYSTRAHMRSRGHVVTLTRNWAQVVVDGATLVLDAPVRVKRGAWLVPQTFIDRVVPRLASQPAPTARPVVTPVQATSASLDAKLEDLRIRSYPSFTRVVVETSSLVAHRVESRGPREVRVRITGLATEGRTESVRDGFVEEMRLERLGTDVVLKIVFEGAAGDVRATALTDPPRLMLDAMRPVERAPAERRDSLTPLRTIVLDAGHGGHDTGAVGPGGLMEKELVLDVTRRVSRLVDERLGVKTLLSRDADFFVTLRDRTRFANKERADLFVSIHANAHRESASEGVETYFLSSEATDSAARHVAALENGVVQLESPSARGRVDPVKSILWDLAQSEFQLESSRLAEVVLDSMTRALRIPNRGVKQAGFYVLGGAAMPAVLIEIGFVTNPKEERKLRESRYRDDIARAIVDGIAEYKQHWDQRTRTALGRGR